MVDFNLVRETDSTEVFVVFVDTLRQMTKESLNLATKASFQILCNSLIIQSFDTMYSELEVGQDEDEPGTTT